MKLCRGRPSIHSEMTASVRPAPGPFSLTYPFGGLALSVFLRSNGEARLEAPHERNLQSQDGLGHCPTGAILLLSSIQSCSLRSHCPPGRSQPNKRRRDIRRKRSGSKRSPHHCQRLIDIVNKLTFEMSGQSGHALPDFYPRFCQPDTSHIPFEEKVGSVGRL